MTGDMRLPWRAIYSATWPDCWGIEDAQGESVVPPSQYLTEQGAEYIVARVNAAFGEQSQ